METYIPIADHVYTEGLEKGMKTSNGWTVERVDLNESGFKGALYSGEYNGKTEYIYATQGTEPTSLKDWATNGSQILTGNANQYKESIKIAETENIDHPGISFTGHSLGGGLASANALSVNGKAITFNAAGLSDATKENLTLSGKTANITAFIVSGEIVDYSQRMIGLKAEGNRIYMPNDYSNATIFGRGLNHMMDSVKTSFQEYKSNLVEQYKNRRK